MFTEEPSGQLRKRAKKKKSGHGQLFDLRNIGLNTLFETVTKWLALSKGNSVKTRPSQIILSTFSRIEANSSANLSAILKALAAAILFNLRQKVIDCGKNFRRDLRLKFFAGSSEDYIRKATSTHPGVRLN